MRYITIDFETYWDSKGYTLSKMGPIEYIRDPRFTPLLMGARIDQKPVLVFEQDEIPIALQALKLDAPETVVVGHNLNGFDALILSEYYGVHPWRLLDTMTMMRWTGLSRVMREIHAALTDYFKNGTKDAGTIVSDGKRSKAEFAPQEWEFFKKYCSDDVLQCSENMYAMLPFMPEDAQIFSSMTAEMATKPVFRLDAAILTEVIEDIKQEAEKTRQGLALRFNMPDVETFYKALRSKDMFCAMLRELGYEPPMKNSPAAAKRGETELVPALAKTDLEFVEMAEHPDPQVAELVRARLQHNSSGQMSRAQTLLKLAQTGKPMPVMLNAFKAHTSRYTAGNSEGKSDGTNVQNIAKRDASQIKIRTAIKAPAGYKVVACDSSQIEARMLAYCACQSDLVGQFRHGRDPYAELAAKIFGGTAEAIHNGAKSGDKKAKIQRNVGKLCILSSGYGVGASKFSDTLLRSGARLADDIEKHHQEAKNAHAIYRQVNNKIVAFWHECEGILDALAHSGSGVFGGPNGNLFQYGLKGLPHTTAMQKWDYIPAITFPTGFSVFYPGLKAHLGEYNRLQYTYNKILKTNVVEAKIYGGAVTENLVQGISFQLLMWQALMMQKEYKLHLAANIHDAWIAVVPEAQAEWAKSVMEYCMSQVPNWLPGFPVACECEIGDDYTIA